MSDLFDYLSGVEIESGDLSSLQYDWDRDYPSFERMRDRMSDLESRIYQEKLKILKQYIIDKALAAGGVYFKPTGTQMAPEELFEDICEFWDRYAIKIIFEGNELICRQDLTTSRVYVFGVKHDG